MACSTRQTPDPAATEASTHSYRRPLDVSDSVLFVHDGKFITSAGGAKSFDAALYLCEHLYGAEVARQLAQGLVIDWDVEKAPHWVVE